MRKVPLSLARDRLSYLISEVAHGGNRIVLESHGRPKAALVSIEDLNRLEMQPVGRSDQNGEMMRWLEETERLLTRPVADDASQFALREVREDRVVDEPGVYRRERRAKARSRRTR